MTDAPADTFNGPLTLPPAPRRSTYLWIAGGLAAFLLYGSGIPFDIHPQPPGQFAESFSRMLTSYGDGSLSDFATNLLLMLPLTFVLCGAFCVDRRGLVAIVTGCLGAFLIGLTLSFAAETFQILIPERTAAIGDIAAQTLGNLVGIGLWLVLGPPLTGRLRRVMAARSRASLLTYLLAVYAGIWMVLEWLPLDLTLRPAEILQKFREGRIVLWLVPPHPLTVENAVAWGLDLLAAIPVGALAVVGWTRSERLRPASRAIVLAILAVVATECVKVLVFSRSASTFDLVTGSAGVLVGVLAVRWLGPGLGYGVGAGRERRLSARVRIAIAIWIAVLVAYHWNPFDFTGDWAVIRVRWSRMSLLPFINYEVPSAFVALDDFARKFLLALPLGLLFGISAREGSENRRAGAMGPLFVAGLVFFVIETGQLLLPSRIPDVTDVLTQLLGAGLGLWLATRRVNSAPGERIAPADPGEVRRPSGAGAVVNASPINPEFKPKAARRASQHDPGDRSGRSIP